MLPRLPFDYVHDHHPGGLVLLGQGDVLPVLAGVLGADLEDVSLRDLRVPVRRSFRTAFLVLLRRRHDLRQPSPKVWQGRHRMTLSLSLPSFRVPVVHVVLVRPQEQVLWSHTLRVVAPVQDEQRSRYLPEGKHPRNTVRSMRLPFELKGSVVRLPEDRRGP